MNKITAMLSLCRKAGKLRIGFEPVRDSVAAGEAKLVLYAADFSPRSRKRMEAFLEESGVPPERRDLEATMDDLSRICGKSAGVVAVADESFAAGLRKLMCGPDEGGAE